MANLKYEAVEFIPTEILKSELESEDPVRISKALYAACRCENDCSWLQNECLRFLKAESVTVRWAAATCLGDLAMFKRPIDPKKVLAALEEAAQDVSIADPAKFSISLVRQFCTEASI
jgi:hypothetical protein